MSDNIITDPRIIAKLCAMFESIEGLAAGARVDCQPETTLTMVMEHCNRMIHISKQIIDLAVLSDIMVNQEKEIERLLGGDGE